MIEPIICKGCQQSLSSDAFYTDKTKPSGLRGKCKTCMKQDEQDRKAKNPDAWRKRAAERAIRYYYRHHEANKQKNKAKEKRRREVNGHHVRQLEALGRERNRPAIRSRQREARQQNPQHFKAVDVKRYSNPLRKMELLNRGMVKRALKHGCKVYLVSPVELLALYRKPCAACKAVGRIHIDHIIPLVLKGNHGIGNLQPLCAECNLSKGSKTMTQWKNNRRLDAQFANSLPYL